MSGEKNSHTQGISEIMVVGSACYEPCLMIAKPIQADKCKDKAFTSITVIKCYPDSLLHDILVMLSDRNDYVKTEHGAYSVNC